MSLKGKTVSYAHRTASKNWYDGPQAWGTAMKNAFVRGVQPHLMDRTEKNVHLDVSTQIPTQKFHRTYGEEKHILKLPGVANVGVFYVW